MRKPFLVVIDGPIGAGKSTVAKLLHKQLERTALISLDRIKWLLSDCKREEKLSVRLASDIGVAMAKEYLSQGVNVIVEKAFTRDEYVRSFIQFVKHRRVPLFIYQVEAPLEVLLKRVKQRPFPEGVKRKPSQKKIRQNYANYQRYKYPRARVFDSARFGQARIAKEMLREIGR